VVNTNAYFVTGGPVAAEIYDPCGSMDLCSDSAAEHYRRLPLDAVSMVDSSWATFFDADRDITSGSKNHGLEAERRINRSAETWTVLPERYDFVR